MKFFAIIAALVSVAACHPAVSQWSLPQLSEAIQDPSTDAALLPYLEQALNELMLAIFTGSPQETVTVVLPADLVSPAEVVAPVAPAAPASSPLVQIILNINQKGQEVGVGPATGPTITPEPIVVEQPDVPVNPIDEIAILPVLPINPIDEISILPPVNPIDEIAILPVLPVNPIDEIAILPVLPVNPIDTIAITPEEINPIDLLQPIPVVQPAIIGNPLV